MWRANCMSEKIIYSNMPKNSDQRQVIQKGEIKNNCEVDVRYILYCMIHEGKFANFREVGRRRRVRVRVNLDKNG